MWNGPEYTRGAQPKQSIFSIRRAPIVADNQSNPPKLLDQVRTTIRLRGMSYQTEKTYADWVKRFILFHDKRHPKEMGAPEIRDFLAHLVNDRNVAASTRNQALHSILFLYREVFRSCRKR
jgi:hypothetical protein